jgi:hypothetical protein
MPDVMALRKVLEFVKRHPVSTPPVVGALAGAGTGALFSDEDEELRGALQGALLGTGIGGGAALAGAGSAAIGRAMAKVLAHTPTPEHLALIGAAGGGTLGGLLGQRRYNPWAHRRSRKMIEAPEKEAALSASVRRDLFRVLSEVAETGSRGVAEVAGLVEDRRAAAKQKDKAEHKEENKPMNDQTAKQADMLGAIRSRLGSAAEGASRVAGSALESTGRGTAELLDKVNLDQLKKYIKNKYDPLNVGRTYEDISRLTPAAQSRRAKTVGAGTLGAGALAAGGAGYAAFGGKKKEEGKKETEPKKEEKPVEKEKEKEASVALQADPVEQAAAFEFGIDVFLKKAEIEPGLFAKAAGLQQETMAESIRQWLLSQVEEAK